VRRLFQWRKPSSWDVAVARRGSPASSQLWRAEIGPTLPRVRPRPFEVAQQREFSFECLIFAEVGDGHSEGIDRNQFVGYVGFENENKVRGVKIALQLTMVSG
jgi:hypothetical protein